MPADWNLRETFPQLPWASEADLFLRKAVLERSTIIDQLSLLAITRVEPHEMVAKGLIGIGNKSFYVLISSLCDSVQQMRALGHEMGHTFHLDCFHENPCHRYPDITRENRDEDVEDFCEAFGMKWFDLQPKPDLREFMALLSRNTTINISPVRCMRSPLSTFIPCPSSRD